MENYARSLGRLYSGMPLIIFLKLICMHSCRKMESYFGKTILLAKSQILLNIE